MSTLSSKKLLIRTFLTLAIFSGIGIVAFSWITPVQLSTSHLKNLFDRKHQIALIQLAKESKLKGGVTRKEADTLEAWALEYGIPSEKSKKNGPPMQETISIGPIKGIPIIRIQSQ